MRCVILRFVKLSEIVSKHEMQARFYARWAHRRHARILTPEQYNVQEKSEPTNNSKNNLHDNIIELDSFVVQDAEKQIPVQKSQQKNNKPLFNSVKQNLKLFDFESIDAKTHLIERPKQKNKPNENKTIKHTSNQVLHTTFDKEGIYIYTKMKDNDPKIGSLMVMVKSRKLRNKKESILLEGKRIIKDALLAGCILEHLMFSRKSDLEYIKNLLPKKNVQLYKMAYRDMQMWSDLTTCPGIMGIFKTPQIKDLNLQNTSPIPLTIICDNIREPGNLGAILRASVAVGSEKILLTKGCVDLWEPKVIRSSSGAHFRLPIYTDFDWSDCNKHFPQQFSLYLGDNNLVTANENDSKDVLSDLCLRVPVLPYYNINFGDCKSIVLVIGGETLGLSEESYKLAMEKTGIRLNIPLCNGVESLNTGTALGVIVFEIKRQLLTKK